MAEDITSLEIRVDSKDVKTADRDLDKFVGSSKKADKELDNLEKGSKRAGRAAKGAGSDFGGLGKQVLGAAAAYVSVTAAINGFRKVIQVTRDFQVLRASLQSSTGSIENMEMAWKALQQFAATTPYTLDQSIEGFNKLVNLGLTPSQRALTSYGDTAAATGKQLTDMIEAVADAATGEFERLKEFGIKASKEGDKVTFTFRGVQTEVQNSAEAIEEYLIRLGENNFAGNMANRMETLDGKFSNLEDSWNNFLYNLGTSTGAAEAFGGALDFVAGQVQELNQYVTSGQLASEFEGWAIAARGFGQAWIDVLGTSTDLNEESAQLSGEAWDDFVLKIQGIPPLVQGVVANAATDFWLLVEAAKAVGAAVLKEMRSTFMTIQDISSTTFASIKALAQGDVYNAVEGFKSGLNEAGYQAQERENESTTVTDMGNRLISAIDNWEVRREAIHREFEDTLVEQQTARATADLKRLNYTIQQTQAPDVDLGQFKVAPASEPSGALFPAGSSTGGGGRSGGGGGSAGTSFSQLEEQLLGEEDRIRESYDRRLQVIKDNTTEGSMHQAELSLALIDQQEEEELRMAEKALRDEESVAGTMERQNEIVRNAYEQRKGIILGITEQTEEEKAELLAEAHNSYIRALHAQQQQTVDEYLEGAKGFFSDLSSIGSAFGETGFKIAKAAAIAEATINMYASAVAAYKTGAAINPVLGPVFAAAALAAGAAQIAKIKSQQYREYEHGGMIPAGATGIVGEAGPELVKGPAMVTSARTTADRQKGGSKGVQVQVNNYAGVEVETRTSETDQAEMIELIVRRARDEVANDLRKGGNPISGAVEGTYALTRGRQAS